MKTDTLFNLLSPAEMAHVADDVGVYKATKAPSITYLSAFMAGIFISVGFVFYITTTTGTAGVIPFGVAKFLGGLCFALGLMLVVVCGADLFTSTVLTIVAKATGRITWGQMFANWTGCISATCLVPSFSSRSSGLPGSIWQLTGCGD